MARLAPCHGCGRHVLVTETSCPFCSQQFEQAPEATQGDWGKKILRIGAIAAAGALAACGDPGGPSADYGAPPEPDMSPDDDGGMIEDDAGTIETDGGDPGGGNADYGAPPAP